MLSLGFWISPGGVRYRAPYDINDPCDPMHILVIAKPVFSGLLNVSVNS